jgi:hypothetical protein
MDERRGGEIEALREVIREVEHEAAPEVDWERMEARLFDRLEHSAAPVRSARTWKISLAFAAAAAIALLSFALLRGSSEPIATQQLPGPAPAGPQLIGPEVSGMVDGARLATGDRVVSGAREVVVDHPGRARWTLAPGSAAALDDIGERLTIRLESGAVLSSVVPSTKPESFAIVTGDVRVAVHGTSFRVERRDHRALVTVDQGVVAVGPASPGPTRGFLLSAGDRGSFTLDGKTGTVQRATSAQLSEPESRPRPVTQRQRPEPPVVVAPPLPDLPTTAELERGLDRVAAGVTRCFFDHTESGEVRVTARTKLAAKVRPDGSIAELSFDPPLAPAVQKCVLAVQHASKFPASVQGAAVERSILLGP